MNAPLPSSVDFPSPTLPIKGRVSPSGLGNVGPKAHDGTSPFIGEDGRGQSTNTVRTTCPYCGVGCGILATPQPDGSVAVAGDPEHPANFGRLCSKGSALGETLSLSGRLLHPENGGRRASWDEALDLVASTLSRTTA